MFTESEKRELVKMDKSKKADSNFVLKCTKFLYKDNLHIVQNRTVKRKRNDEKMVMTPAKRDAIAAAMQFRCDSIGEDVDNKRFTDGAVNRHISNAIQNIARAQKSKKVLSEDSDDDIDETIETDFEYEEDIFHEYVDENGYIVQEIVVQSDI